MHTYLFIEEIIVTQIKNVLLPHLPDLYTLLHILQTIEIVRISPIQQGLEQYKGLVHIPYIYIYSPIRGVFDSPFCFFVRNTHIFTHDVVHFGINFS